MEEYNEMTPHELNLIAEVHSDKMQMDQEEKLMMAYMTAYWHRIDKLEPFDQILKKMKEPKQMSDMEMLLKVQQLNAALGGNVV